MVSWSSLQSRQKIMAGSILEKTLLFQGSRKWSGIVKESGQKEKERCGEAARKKMVGFQYLLICPQ